MNVKFSSSRFPLNPSIKDGSGVLWGVVLQPFTNTLHTDKVSNTIERCTGCFAYINSFTKFLNRGWICNICSTVNPYKFNKNVSDDYDNSYQQNSPYSDPNRRATLPELLHQSLECSYIDENEEQVKQLPQSLQNLLENPIYIAVLDLTGKNDNNIKFMISGLESLVNSLPDNTQFGCIVINQKIGLFNFHSTTPLIKYLENNSLKQSVGFQDILNLKTFLVNLNRYKNNILNSIKVLTLISRDQSGPLNPLGQTIQSLIEYLNIDENLKLNVKVGLFLSSYPNCGVGEIVKNYDGLENAKKQYETGSFLKPSNKFYELQAENSIKVGIHYDMYIIGDKFVGLGTIRFLSTMTGGQIYKYKDLSNTEKFVKDIEKLIQLGWGFHGILRIRTSKNFKIDNCFGNCFQSKKYDNLIHIESSNPFTSLAFDFKFTNPTAFEVREVLPTIQIVFSYKFLLPCDGKSNIRKIENRLHIYNTSISVSSTVSELFKGIDLETTISLLTLKLIRESLEKGIREARLLLEDWLMNIIIKYNENIVILSNIVSQADISFQQLPNLRLLPRYVFGLLKSPLLREMNTDLEGDIVDKKSDDWMFYQSLYNSLEPRLLHRAIYPLLYSYLSPSLLNSKYLPLSIYTINNDNNQLIPQQPQQPPKPQIYLLDTFDKLMVYFNQETIPDILKDSIISQTILQSKKDRLQTPLVKDCHSPLDQCKEFTDYFVEDENVFGISFNEFQVSINKLVKKNF